MKHTDCIKLYPRTNGTYGIRNYLLVLSTVALTNRWAELISEKTDVDIKLVTGNFLRGLRGDDAEVQDRILKSCAVHPNVGASLVLCFDKVSAEEWRQWAAMQHLPISVICMIESDGISAAVNEGVKAAEQLNDVMSNDERIERSLADLVVALECGGSDPTSALCSNPAVGKFVERLVQAGGSAIVSETAEFVGTEAIIESRSINEQVSNEILSCIHAAEDRMNENGIDYRGVNPTAENIEAGLTTLIEKSMGAVCKIGECKISGCLKYGETIKESGLYFMDTPFFSPVSMTGMSSAGAQLTLFSMGVFNSSGSPLSPTIKISGNPNTVAVWHDVIDVDVSAVGFNGSNMTDMADKIERVVISACNGEVVKNELLCDGEIIIPRESAMI